MVRGAVALVVVVVVGAGAYLYLNLDDETRRVAKTALDKLCAPLEARVGRATFAAGRGVTMRDVVLVDPRSPQDADPLLRIEEFRLEGDFDVASLLRGKPKVRRVVVVRPEVALVRHRDGTWNLPELSLPPPGDGPSPRVELVDASVSITDASQAGLQPAVFRSIQATAAPSAEARGSADRAMSFVVTLGGGDTASRAALSGVFDPSTSRFEIEARADSLPVESGWLSMLGASTQFDTHVTPWRAAVSFRGEASRTRPEGPIGWRCDFSVACDSLRARVLPTPIHSIRAEGSVGDTGLSIRRAHARWNDATIRLACNREGWEGTAPLTLRAKAEGVETSALPLQLFPEKLQRAWRRFRPSGAGDVAVEARLADGHWTPRATVRFQDASFEDAEKFRYRLTGASGRIDLNGGVDESPAAPAPTHCEHSLGVDLTAMVGGAPVRIAVSMRRPQEAAVVSRCSGFPADQIGWVEVSGVGVPISDRVIDALPGEDLKRFLRSLHPEGRVDLRWRADRQDLAMSKPSVSLDLRLVDCAVNYDPFPYPLHRVSGWVRQRDQRWTFNDLAGRSRSDQATIQATGELAPEGAGRRLVLRFDGSETPLDEALWRAVPEEGRQAWAYLQPVGMVDFTAIVNHRLGTGSAQGQKPEVDLTVRPQGRVTIWPRFCTTGERYRLDRLEGQFDWSQQQLTFRDARALHGATRIGAGGVWRQHEGGWNLELTGLSADRVDLGPDFMAAAPSGLRSLIEALSPQGSIDLYNSSLRVAATHANPDAATAAWDLGVQCHQASIDPGMPLEGISGFVRLVGHSDGVTAQTTGEVDLDSLFWNDLQLTQVRGPLWADASECLIGEGVARKAPSAPRRLSANAYGGAVQINSHIRHSGQMGYGLSAELSQVDLARLASEWMRRPEAIGGKLDGRLEFQGVGPSISGLEGRGALVVNDANLYELPILIRLLKVLRNRTPDDTAFDRCEARFTQRGDQLQFEQLDLLGDAVSLYGRGAASLDRRIDLTFGSIVGRNELAVPILKSFVSSASEQLLRLRVTGSLDAPEVRREALPIVGNMIEQLQGEGAPTATNPARPPVR